MHKSKDAFPLLVELVYLYLVLLVGGQLVTTAHKSELPVKVAVGITMIT